MSKYNVNISSTISVDEDKKPCLDYVDDNFTYQDWLRQKRDDDCKCFLDKLKEITNDGNVDSEVEVVSGDYKYEATQEFKQFLRDSGCVDIADKIGNYLPEWDEVYKYFTLGEFNRLMECLEAFEFMKIGSMFSSEDIVELGEQMIKGLLAGIKAPSVETKDKKKLYNLVKEIFGDDFDDKEYIFVLSGYGEDVDVKPPERKLSNSYYTQNGIEAWDIIDEIEKFHDGSIDSVEAGYLFNIMKYLLRYPYKGSEIKDLKKAKRYLKRLIDYNK